MNMKYKVLALDLDGTLTNSQKKITPRTKETLIKAQQQGLKIILASGRPPFGIKPIAEELELKKYGGYILAFNGGAVIDCSTGETIMQQTLDTNLYPYLYSKGNTNDFNILSYLGDDIACEDIDDEYNDSADDLELGNCYDCCCHHDCVDCDMDDEEYVNVTLPKEDIEILHMLCRIFKV